MTKLLERAGAALLRAFGISLLVYGVGVLAAPDLNNMYALGVAALTAAGTAGIRALQVFKPGWSFKSLLGQVPGAYADAFAGGFLGALFALMIDWLNAPTLDFSRAALTGIVIGAGTAGARALQGLMTKGEWPMPNKGATV